MADHNAAFEALDQKSKFWVASHLDQIDKSPVHELQAYSDNIRSQMSAGGIPSDRAAAASALLVEITAKQMQLRGEPMGDVGSAKGLQDSGQTAAAAEQEEQGRAGALAMIKVLEEAEYLTEDQQRMLASLKHGVEAADKKSADAAALITKYVADADKAKEQNFQKKLERDQTIFTEWAELHYKQLKEAGQSQEQIENFIRRHAPREYRYLLPPQETTPPAADPPSVTHGQDVDPAIVDDLIAQKGGS